MKQHIDTEGGHLSPNNQERGNRRFIAFSSLVGMTLSATVVLTSCEKELDVHDKPYIYTDLDCRPFVLKNIPYDLKDNNTEGLIRTIQTVDHKGPIDEGPCYDEALELVKQQLDPGYPYYGEVTLPKFLVSEGTTLRQFKNQ